MMYGHMWQWIAKDNLKTFKDLCIEFDMFDFTYILDVYINDTTREKDRTKLYLDHLYSFASHKDKLDIVKHMKSIGFNYKELL